MNDVNEPKLVCLKRAIERHDEKHGSGGQSAIAAEMGCSTALLSQLLRGIYPGNAGQWLDRAEKMYGDNASVTCPVLGEISARVCLKYQVKIKKMRDFGAKGGNSQTTRLIRACPCKEGI